MYVFINIVAVFGFIVKLYVKCFYYWIPYQEEKSSEVKYGKEMDKAPSVILFDSNMS